MNRQVLRETLRIYGESDRSIQLGEEVGKILQTQSKYHWIAINLNHPGENAACKRPKSIPVHIDYMDSFGLDVQSTPVHNYLHLYLDLDLYIDFTEIQESNYFVIEVVVFLILLGQVKLMTVTLRVYGD